MNYHFERNSTMQIGGQAVIEGVMMRAPGMVATAVRKPSGEIVVKKEPFRSLAEKHALFKLPILRGAAGLIEMLIIGIRTLNFSAEIAMAEEQYVTGKNGHGQLKKGKWDSLKLGLTLSLSVGAAIAIFFVTPLAATTWMFNIEQDPLAFNLTAGIIRIALLLGYLLAISQLRDVNRLFQYHGAEHKAVFTFEKGEQLEVSAAARQSRFHPRCGTSFLLIVMFAAILLFGLLDTLLIGWLGQIDIIIRLLTHLPLIPLVGGISYEFIKVSAKHSDTVLGKIIVAPGLWLQRITTKEPDPKQMEVALVALKCALGDEPGEKIPEGGMKELVVVSLN